MALEVKEPFFIEPVVLEITEKHTSAEGFINLATTVDLLVNVGAIAIYDANGPILANCRERDEFKVLIKDSDDKNVFGEPIDLFSLKEIMMAENFKGLYVKGNTKWKIIVQHSANVSTPVVVDDEVVDMPYSNFPVRIEFAMAGQKVVRS